MKSRALESALLPDVLVVCGGLEPGAPSVDTPSVLFEVTSRGSKGRDRFEKWRVYQQLASLQHFVLVARDKPYLEVFDRVDGEWTGFRSIDGLDAVLELQAISAELPLREIYNRALAG